MLNVDTFTFGYLATFLVYRYFYFHFFTCLFYWKFVFDRYTSEVTWSVKQVSNCQCYFFYLQTCLVKDDFV